MKTLIVGDLHFKPKLGYADHIPDGRLSEEKEVLDFIFANSKDCDVVVFLGDQLDARNNTSEVIKKFVNFVERFNDGTKQIYILAGNHEKMGDGKSAIDFYREIKDPHIDVIVDSIVEVAGLVFVPYFYKGELVCKDYVSASKVLTKKLPDGDVLFAHLTVSDLNIKGISSNTFNEIILQRKDLEKKYKKVITGHIHLPSGDDFITVAGSVFNNEVGETQKFIYKMDQENLNIETIPLPGRKIVKMENPTIEEISALEKGTILKIILTKTMTRQHIDELKQLANKHVESLIIIEDFKHTRKKAHIEVGKMDFSIDNLLELYSEQKKVDLLKLKKGYELIKQ